MRQHYEAMPRNDANFVPLSPLSFITRTADLFPDRTAVIYGERRYTWAECYARMRRLASALTGAGLAASRSSGWYDDGWTMAVKKRLPCEATLDGALKDRRQSPRRAPHCR